MEIRWHGNNSFEIKDAKTRVFIDPEDGTTGLEGAVILYTSGSDYKTPKDATVFDWPGEYESKGVLVHAVPIGTGKDEKRILNIEVDGVHICNLCGVSVAPSEEIFNELGIIDVLIVPLTLKMKDLVQTIEEVDPRLVIPGMFAEGSAEISGFLKEVGKAGTEALDKVVIKSRLDLDSEITNYAYLTVS